MRPFLIVYILLGALGVFSSLAEAAPDNVLAVNASLATVTPQQARDALAVLNDPKLRSEVENTLRVASAAGGETSSNQVSRPGAASDAQSKPAGGPSAALATSLTSNGLASQISRQAGQWIVQIGSQLRHSMSALLDYGSVLRWWQRSVGTAAGRTIIVNVGSTVSLSFVPGLLLETLSARLLRRRRAKVIVPPQIPETLIGSERGKSHAARHWALLQRLPGALRQLIVSMVPLVVFLATASALLCICCTDGTPGTRVTGALIDVYLVCRSILIVSDFLVAPDAPGLRLIHMRDRSALLAHKRVFHLVCVGGASVALANAAEPLGLSEEAHVAMLKAIALIVHVMIAFAIFHCRKPVAERIRERGREHRSFSFLGNWLADMWAVLSVFFVLALWFVWALDVRNGYRTLFHLGTVSVVLLVAARVVVIVAFGALGRIFHFEANGGYTSKSIAHRRAHRYYPLLRRLIQIVIAIPTVTAVLEVWGVHVLRFFTSGSVAYGLASALVTIGMAALFAVVVWEGTNVLVEHRLEHWTERGDLLRAARLRTLLPMLRTALFVVIAMVVVFTGLSEIGVNTGPLLASASIFGVALGFGSQKLVQDLITGIFLLMENAMQIGDTVTLADVSGTVEHLSIRTVRLRGDDGSLYTVPFSSVSTVNNANRGIGNAAVRVSITAGQDVDLAILTLKEIGKELREDDVFKDGILSDFNLWGVDAVDGSTVKLAGQIRCSDGARWRVQREFNRRILNEFSARGIELADPQRRFLIVNTGARPEPRLQ